MRIRSRYHDAVWLPKSRLHPNDVNAQETLFRFEQRERVINGLGLTAHAFSDPERATDFFRKPSFDPRPHLLSNHASRWLHTTPSPFVSFTDRPSRLFADWAGDGGANVVVEVKVNPDRFLVNSSDGFFGEVLLLGGVFPDELVAVHSLAFWKQRYLQSSSPTSKQSIHTPVDQY